MFLAQTSMEQYCASITAGHLTIENKICVCRTILQLESCSSFEQAKSSCLDMQVALGSEYTEYTYSIGSGDAVNLYYIIIFIVLFEKKLQQF